MDNEANVKKAKRRRNKSERRKRKKLRLEPFPEKHITNSSSVNSEGATNSSSVTTTSSRDTLADTSSMESSRSSPQPKPDDEIITRIDGSYGEGGGQLIRNAITYAVLLQKRVTLHNIRANRPHPQGLRPQHLTGIRLAVEIGGGTLVGDETGSSTVSYAPVVDTANSTANHDDRQYVADTKTAGSIALLLQSSLLPAFVQSLRYWAKSSSSSSSSSRSCVNLELRGGTNAEMAPQLDYVTSVFLPFFNDYFRHCAAHPSNSDDLEPSAEPFQIDIERRGYFPKGGGIVHAKLRPPAFLSKIYSDPQRHCPKLTFPPIDLTNCAPIASLSIHAFHAGNCPKWIPEKMVQGALKALRHAYQHTQPFRTRFVPQTDTTENLQTNNNDQLTHSKSNQNNSNHNTFVSHVIENANIQIIHETNCIGSGSGIIIVAHTTFSNTNIYLNHDNHNNHNHNNHNRNNHNHNNHNHNNHNHNNHNHNSHKQRRGDNNKNQNIFTSSLPLAASALGNRKSPPLKIGHNAAKELIECISSGGCVDRWMQDQLILFMALADSKPCNYHKTDTTNDHNNDNDNDNDNNGRNECSKSQIMTGELTLHTQTAMKVAEWMTGCQFEVERLDHINDNDNDNDNSNDQSSGTKKDEYGKAGRILGRHIIRCKGIGFDYFNNK